MLRVLPFAVALSAIAVCPAEMAAQSLDSLRADTAHLTQNLDREPATHFAELAAPDARIAFGVRHSTIQHVVATSPFDDGYAAAVEHPDTFTLQTVHRFGQVGPYPPVLWNLSDRVRIAFGAGVESTPMIDAGSERPTVPLGSLSIEFGDRK
jgi:hypothetical protein